MAIAYNPKIVTDGLVLALDASNPKSYPGTGATLTNLVNTTNNATILNSPTYTSGYFELNGSNQYVNCGNSSTFNAQVFTVSFWFNPVVLAIKELAMKNTNANSGPGPFEIFVDGAGKIKHRINGTNDVTSNGSVSTGIWKMITLTYDLSKRKLYFNDLLDIETAYSTAITYTTGDLTWGAYGNGQYAVNAKISSLMYYNRALSDQEIKQNFNATRGRYGV